MSPERAPPPEEDQRPRRFDHAHPAEGEGKKEFLGLRKVCDPSPGTDHVEDISSDRAGREHRLDQPAIQLLSTLGGDPEGRRDGRGIARRQSCSFTSHFLHPFL